MKQTHLKSYPIFHFKNPNQLRPSSTLNPELDGRMNSLPPELWNLSEPPPELFIQGSKLAMNLLERLPRQGLAVVGTRNPQLRSLHCVRQIIQELSQTNLIIISGLANGVDTAAHSSALEQGLPTIAILGAGLHVSYPRQNMALRYQILENNGLLVSEYPSSTPARGYHFLRRNRLIAGWSQATWVVEAGQRSGALNTARWAREQNRFCFALPCFPNDPAFTGNQTLLDRDHALAFWGTHSLGAAWLELATFQCQKNVNLTAPTSSTDSTLLAKLVQKGRHSTATQGGISLQEILNWGLLQGWTAKEIVTALNQAFLQKQLLNRNNVVSANDISI